MRLGICNIMRVQSCKSRRMTSTLPGCLRAKTKDNLLEVMIWGCVQISTGSAGCALPVTKFFNLIQF